MYTGYYLPYVSGMTIYVRRLAEGLVRRGHHVTVLCARHDPNLPPVATENGVRIERSPVIVSAGKGVVAPLMWRDQMRLLADHDVFHRHVPGMGDSWLSTRIAKSMGKPVVFTHHCDLYLPFGVVNDAANAVLNTELRFAGNLADLIVSYSEDYVAYSRFLSHFRDKVRTVFPPIAIGTPDNARATAWRSELGLERVPVVGFAGRFAADKGGDVLLRAIPRLRELVPGAHVVFAGEFMNVPGERFYRDSQALLAPVRDAVTFLGNVAPERMPDFYRLCDVVTVPSTNSTESWGMWQNEAMLCGTPVVTSDLPGVRVSIRTTGMGLLVRPHDWRGLAEALARVLTERDAFIAPSGSFVDPRLAFDSERTFDAYETWYADLTAGREPAHIASPSASPPTTIR
jgi:glycosyltransferase involved in cell wall biosynthesis